MNRDISKAQETASDEKSHYGAYIPLVNINAFNKEMQSISAFFTPAHTKRPEFAGHQDKFGLLQDVAETLVESGLSLQAAEQLLEDDKIAIVLNQAEQFDKADDDAGNSAVLKFSRGRGKVGHRLAALETALFDGPALSSDPVTDRALKTIELASAILNDHRIRHASTAPALAKALAVGLNGAAGHVVAQGISSSASGVKQSLYNLAAGMIGENPSQTLGLSAAVDNAYKDADRAAKIHQKARHVVKKSASVSIETGSVLTMMMESSTSYQDPLINMERGRSLVLQERTPEQILETSPERLKDTWLSKHKSEARSFVQDCHETRKKWSPKSSTIDHVKAIVSAGISFSKSVQETAAFSMKIVKLIPVPRIRATVAVLEAQAYLTDVACKFIETWVRRSVRVVTGNPGAAQDAGECLAFVAAVVNPNKAAKLGNLTKITSKVSKVEQLAAPSTPAPKPMTIASSSTPSTASATKQAATQQRSLLPGEGKVGTFDELKKQSDKGDHLSSHHIPNSNYMTSKGVKRSDGVSITVEDPRPGVGGRHREIHKVMIAQDITLSPRDALAQSIRRAQEVYKKDGVYTDEIRKSLRDVIDLNKSKFPHLFEKGSQ